MEVVTLILFLFLDIGSCLDASTRETTANTSLARLPDEDASLADERLCSALCSLGPPALPVASLAACAGSLLTTGVAGVVCPMAMVTWGVGSAVLGPAFCPSLCKSMTTANRRMDGDNIADRLFEYTGVFVGERSVLAPVLWTARLLGVLLMSFTEGEEGSGLLARSICPAMCSADLAKAAGIAGCGAGLSGALDNTVVSDYLATSLVCPLAIMGWGAYDSLVSPVMCTGACTAVQARLPQAQNVLPALAIVGGLASLFAVDDNDAFVRGTIWILQNNNQLTNNPRQYLDYFSFIQALRTFYMTPPASNSIGIEVELQVPGAAQSAVSPILKMDFGPDNGYIYSIKIGNGNFVRFTDEQINYAKQKSFSDFYFDIGRITKNIVVTNTNQFRNEKLMTLTHLTAEAMRFDHVYLAINKVLRGKTNAIGFQGSDLNWSRLKPIVTNWSNMGFRVPTTLKDVSNFKDTNPSDVSVKLIVWYKLFHAKSISDELYKQCADVRCNET